DQARERRFHQRPAAQQRDDEVFRRLAGGRRTRVGAHDRTHSPIVLQQPVGHRRQALGVGDIGPDHQAEHVAPAFQVFLAGGRVFVLSVARPAVLVLDAGQRQGLGRRRRPQSRHRQQRHQQPAGNGTPAPHSVASHRSAPWIGRIDCSAWPGTDAAPSQVCLTPPHRPGKLMSSFLDMLAMPIPPRDARRSLFRPTAVRALAGLAILLAGAALLLPRLSPGTPQNLVIILLVGALLLGAMAMAHRGGSDCDVGPPALTRRYLRALMGSMSMYVLVLCASIWLLKRVDPPALRAIIALAPVVPIGFAVRAMV